MVTLIPARIGSKGVPLKNLCDLGGYPLLAWSIAAARLLGYDMFVSTDSADIQQVAKKYGCPAYILTARGHKDNSTDIDVVADFLTKKKADEIIYLRPTTPFRNPVVLQDALDWWKSGDYDSLCSCHILTESADKYLKRGESDMVVPYNPNIKLKDIHHPHQQLTETIKTNGVIDIFRTNRISGGVLLGENMFGFLTPPVIEIDEPEELFYANEWLNRHGHPLFDYLKAVYG